MTWLKRFPWLACLILLLTYGIFGWLYGSWTIWIVEKEQEFGWLLRENIATVLIELFGAFLVLLLALAFAAPIALMTFSMGNWIKNETRAFFGLLLISVIGVILIYWLEYLAQLLLLLAAASLFRLELQKAGYKQKQSTFILTIFCLLGFGGGLLAFALWSYQS
jgi:hypothetical protein